MLSGLRIGLRPVALVIASSRGLITRVIMTGEWHLRKGPIPFRLWLDLGLRHIATVSIHLRRRRALNAVLRVNVGWLSLMNSGWLFESLTLDGVFHWTWLICNWFSLGLSLGPYCRSELLWQRIFWFVLVVLVDLGKWSITRRLLRSYRVFFRFVGLDTILMIGNIILSWSFCTHMNIIQIFFMVL